MKRIIQNIVTFWIERKLLKKEFLIRLNGLTNERIIKKTIFKNKYLVDYQSIYKVTAEEGKIFADNFRKYPDKNWIVNLKFNETGKLEKEYNGTIK